MHTTGSAPVQVPVWQVSVWVQALPSLQAVPLGLVGYWHRPVLGLHVPAVWHWSGAAQVTVVPGVQTFHWQVSPLVQALPSLQAVPLGRPEHPVLDTGTKRRLST